MLAYRFCRKYILLAAVLILSCIAEENKQIEEEKKVRIRIKRKVSGYTTIFSNGDNHWLSTNTTLNAVIGDRVSAISGVVININCSYEGYPTPRVIWFINGKIVDHVTFPEVKITANKAISVLTLKNLTSQYAGEYNCMVLNEHDRNVKASNVRIIEPYQPTIFSERSVKLYSPLEESVIVSIGTNVTVYDGTSISINCPVQAASIYTIKWTTTSSSQRLLGVNTNTNLLQLTGVDAADSGVYKCLVNDDEKNGDMQYSKIIVVRKIAPKIASKNDTVRYTRSGAVAVLQIGVHALIKAGYDVFLACPYDAVPKAESRWKRNGMQLALPTKNVYVENYRNQLVIKNIKEEHSDVYTCEIENLIGSDSASTKIEVLPKDSSAPKIVAGRRSKTVEILSTEKVLPISIGESVRVIEGAPLKLVCRTKGLPKPDLIWELNRKPISDDSIIISGDMLLILSFQNNFVGEYKCTARNVVGEDRAWTDVRIIVPMAPKISSGKSFYKIAGQNGYVDINIGDNLKTTGGRDVIITCKAEAQPSAELRWKVGDFMIANEPAKFVVDDERKTLTIKDVNEWNSARYWCFASNGAGVAVSSSYINILPRNAPMITSNEQVRQSFDTSPLVEIEIGTNITSSTGKTLRIFCPSEGSKNASYDWTINGNHLRYDTRISLNNGYELIVRDLQFFDEGVYACRVYNQFGFDKMSSTVKLVAGQSLKENGGNNEDQKITELTVGNDITVISGKSIAINCPTRGSVRPHLSWLKDNLPLSPGAKSLPKGEILVLNLVDKSMSGRYTCVQRTDLGTNTESSNINVIEYQPVLVQPKTGYIRGLYPSEIIEATIGQTVIALSGVTIKMRCPHVAMPAATIQWYFNDVAIDTETKYAQDKQSDAIIISKMSESYAGTYTCRAAQGTQVSEGKTRLQYLRMLKPSIKISNKNYKTIPDIYVTNFLTIGDSITANLNKKIQIDCDVHAIPKPKIFWKFNEQILTKRQGITDLGNGTIVIQSVVWRHGGKYDCFAVNEAGIATGYSEIRVVETYIPLNFKPTRTEIKMLEPSLNAIRLELGANAVVLAGNSILIKCSVSLYGTVPVKWKKDDKPLVGTRHHYDGSVYISKLEAIDTGVYECLSNDRTLYKFGTINVTVLAPAKTLLEDNTPRELEYLTYNSLLFKANMGDDVRILKGNKLELRCPVISTSTKVDWLLNNVIFSGGIGVELKKNILYFDGAFVNGKYNFTCRVTGPIDSVDLTSQLSIEGPSKIEIVDMKDNNVVDNILSLTPTSKVVIGGNINILDGSSLEMNCPVHSIPPPKITWKYNGRDIQQFTGYLMKNNGLTLILIKAQKENEGSYECIASNGDEVVKLSSNINIYVPQKPKIMVSHASSSAKAGVLSNPNVVTKKRVSNTSNTLEDNGVFTEEMGRDYRLLQGSKLKLMCQVQGEPKPTMQWKKDGVPIDDIVGEEKDFITIDANDVEKNSGTYSCTASNVFGYVTETSIVDIIVPTKPEIQRDPKKGNKTELLSYMEGKTRVDVFIGDNLSTISGTIVMIRCPAIGVPRADITFKKDGAVLQNNKYTFIDELGTLTISPASFENNSPGVYTCHAVNSAGNADMNTTLTLYAPSKPEILSPSGSPKFSYDNVTLKGTLELTIGQNATAYYGTTLIVKCPLVGFPFPMVLWQKDGEITSEQSLAVLKNNSTTLVSQFTKSTVFTCTATNMAGRAQQESSIIRVESLPATILSSSQKTVTAEDMTTNITIGNNVNVLYGSSLTITCPSIGEPKPVIQWALRNSKEHFLELHPNITFSGTDIHITFVNNDLIGNYYCSASNVIGSDKKNSVVKLIDTIPPNILAFHNKFIMKKSRLNVVKTTIGGDLYVFLNTKVIIECPVSGFPPPQVTWLKDGNEILDRSDQYNIDKNILTIARSHYKYQGSYTCVASSHMTSVEATTEFYTGFVPFIDFVPKHLSPLISLTNYGLTIPIGIQDAHVTEGSIALFKCKSYAYPVANISWYINGYPVDKENNKKYDVSVPSILTVRDINKNTDEGKYSCQATNVYGQDEKSTQLKVLQKPSIHSDSTNITLTQYTATPVQITVGGTIIVPKGLTIIIRCHVTGSPQPSVMWSKVNGTFIVDPRISIEKTNDLQIQNLDLTDSGEYKCFATNQVTTVSSSSYILVAEKPQATIFPNYRSSPYGKTSAYSDGTGKIIVVPGSPFQLSCHVTGSPEPKVAWLKEHDVINSRERYVVNEGELEVKHAQHGDEGVYMCVATNIMGTTTAIFHVSLGAAPVFHVFTDEHDSIESEIQISIGSNADMNVGSTLHVICNVTGVPAPKLIWKKNGLLLNVPIRAKTGVNDFLTIRDVRKHDEGSYFCHAKNVVGSTKAETIISVIDPAKTYVIDEKYTEDSDFVFGRIKEVHAIEGSSIRLSCYTLGHPRPITSLLGSSNPLKPNMLEHFVSEDELNEVTTYLKDAANKVTSAPQEKRFTLRNKRISFDNRLRTFVIAEMKFTSLKLNHNGRYTCMTKNSAGNDTAELNLFVHQHPEKPYTGVWMHTAFGLCTPSCVEENIGKQFRNVSCIDYLGRKIQDAFCNPVLKPLTESQCSTQECATEWRVWEWSECTTSCGHDGKQRRVPYCVYTKLDQTTSFNHCLNHKKPSLIRSCNAFPCHKDQCADHFQYCSLMDRSGFCHVELYKTLCCSTCVKSKNLY